MPIQILIFLVVAHLILPGYFIYSLWRGREHDRCNWLVKVLYSGAYLLFILLAGRWDWMSHYLRLVLVVLFAVAVAISYRRARESPFFVRGGRARWLHAGGALLGLLVFLGFLVFAIRGFFYPGEPVRLAFPLQGGWYYVAQGGNSPLLNAHNLNRAQRYALDVVELNAAGGRAWGIYPAALDRYAIFGATVHSPCDGAVVRAVDGLPDLIPPATDREHLAGNHVVIACQGVNVLLAHLQNGSLTVREGERVSAGRPLGRVGNSGNTSEPHLHVHAVPAGSEDVLKGEGVPLLFEGRFRVRNAILIK